MILPDKTDAGHVEKGIDFLGYRLSPKGLTMSQQTLSRLATNMFKLQEQQISDKRLRTYWRRFLTWCFSGLRDNIDWESWLTTALKYFGKEDLLKKPEACCR